MGVSHVFGTRTCISLLILTLINPELAWGDDDIKSSLRTASNKAQVLSSDITGTYDVQDCSIFLGDYAPRYLESAIEKYDNGDSKHIIIQQIEEAQHCIKLCQQSPDGKSSNYLPNLEQDLVDLQLLLNKTKEQVSKINK